MRLHLALALLAAPAAAEEFRWATTTDPATLDPHAQSSAPVLSLLNNVYEGLVRRNRDMEIEPSLAVSWEPFGAMGSEGWRFTLREGVTFHDGATFDAEDVAFSYERAASETSDVRSWFASVAEVTAPDPYTVEFRTTAPNPIFPESIANFLIVDSGWAIANDAAKPDREQGGFATLNANGTGPFRVMVREPGLRTVLEPFDGWWDEAEHDVSIAVHTPVRNSATAVAALLSGEVDFIDPVPIQDAERVAEAEGVKLAEGVEARTMMLGFNQDRETLFSGDVERNPFQDARVRRAVAHAIDVDAITEVIMRGAAEPVGQIVDPASRGFSEPYAAPIPHDPERARALLAEAGHADGFAFAFACPNDRYINDEAVCQAVAGMLAKVGLRPALTTMPVAQYWPALRAGEFDLHLLGWSPGTFDAEHPLRFLAATPDGRMGTWNFGGFSNARIDALLPEIQSEIDDARRQGLIDEVMGILREETAYVPLYVQPLLWGVAEDWEVAQRADNFFLLRWVRKAK